jgi:hypothetical protein
MSTARLVPLVLLMTTSLGGCIPWRREVLVQPALEIRVTDPEGLPLEDARVLFLAASNPHHVPHHSLELRTGPDGSVTLEERRERETIYPLMMHGVPHYYWTWCAEKPGHEPEVRVEYDPEPLETLVLERGASGSTCRLDGGRIRVE